MNSYIIHSHFQKVALNKRLFLTGLLDIQGLSGRSVSHVEKKQRASEQLSIDGL